MDNKQSSSGIGLGSLVFLVFLVLKLVGVEPVANWSWWWVTSPLWLPLVVVLLIIGVVAVIAWAVQQMQ